MATPAPIYQFKGIGPLGNPLIGDVDQNFSAAGRFTDTISKIIGVLTISAGIWFIVQMFTGAVQWLSSAGEKQALENAKKKISNAILGLLVVVMSYTIIGIVGSFMGLDILNLKYLILRIR
jgi:hypothetical protein